MTSFDLLQFVELPQLGKSKIVRKNRSSVLDYVNELKNDLSIRLTDLWTSNLDLMDLFISKPDCGGNKLQMYHFRYKCIIEDAKRSQVGYYHAQTAGENDKDTVYAYMVIYLHNFGLYEIVVLADNLLRADFYLNGTHLGYVTAQKRDFHLSIWKKIAYFFGHDGTTLQRTAYFNVYDSNDVLWGDIDITRRDGISNGISIGISDKIYLRTPQNVMIPILVHAFCKKIKLNTIGGWLRLLSGISIPQYPAPIILRYVKESIPPDGLPFFFALSLFFRGYIHAEHEGERNAIPP